MKYGQSMDVGDPKVDPEIQGQRSRSPGQKTCFEASFDRLTGKIAGQGPHGMTPRLTLKVKAKLSNYISYISFHV